MDNLNGLQVFVSVVQSGSLVGAGERLGLSASAVGKALARLEQRLGAVSYTHLTLPTILLV